METTIQLLNPADGKTGAKVDKVKYEIIKDAILAVLKEEGPVQFKELASRVSERIHPFKGSVSWYVTAVKLDLEARGKIERLPGVKPQQVRLDENWIN